MGDDEQDSTTTAPPDEDPWLGDNEDGDDDPVVSTNVVATNEPQIAVRTPEGQTVYVPASEEKQYADLGFEVLVKGSEFGPGGTKTAQADPGYVEFGKKERALANAKLKRGL